MHYQGKAHSHKWWQSPLRALRELPYKEAYRVSMINHAELYCCQCQHSNLPLPSQAPLKSMPTGKPWKRVAVNILSVPVSTNGNKCARLFY